MRTAKMMTSRKMTVIFYDCALAKMSAFFGVCYFEENKTESVILNNANDGETLIANECDDDVVNVIFGESEIQSARFCSYIQFFSLFLFSNCAIQEI